MWLAAVMAVAVAGAGLIPQDRTLRFRPAANTEYAYNSVSETSMAISGMMEQSSDTKVTSTRVLKIKDTVDGWTKFEWHSRNVKTESTGEAMPGMDPNSTGKVMEQVVVAGEVNELATVRNIRVVDRPQHPRGGWRHERPDDDDGHRRHGSNHGGPGH